MEEVYCRVYGRVQLVMFRDFTKRKARSLGLRGYVRNMDDGSVEVVAQGPREDLEKLVAHLRRGPLLARVERVDVERRQPVKTYADFTIVL
ncbi:acylphosphatase [Candidatus Kaiserbacteria bacterium CG10_big_fil_rev_8_21_14_0_10_59_10]|uniref:acylphosphatase n=1 Tax=Candidatus Kaiserbacteria bacterium CG10_big_fil_rev_8_21_14_0_10_59_10 TaxID=1974612 RepID=A0A2H0U8G5_9BACT|nr:MAG: acylphosphatase [Candidatus Kaiserbacteria bacterium CG10_big_fil_rev_8_21_14_0_10_59_10]